MLETTMKRFVKLFSLCLLIKILLLSTIYCLLPTFVSAQTPEWVYQYGKGGFPNAIAVNSVGSSFFTGLSYGIVTGKIALDGVERWIYHYDTTSNVLGGEDISVDRHSNVYVAGGCSPNCFVVIKLDSLGNEKWVYLHSPPVYDASALAVKVFSTNSIYAAGDSYINISSRDMMAVRLDSLGNEKWIYTYDGPAGGYDIAACLAIDKNENIYVGGYSTGIGTSTDFTVIKLDSAGNEKWVYRYDGPAHYRDEIMAMAIDTSGCVYVTGWSWGIECDFCVIKLDSAGNEKWVYRYNGPANIGDAAYGLAVDDSGYVYVCGVAGSDSVSLFTGVKIDTNGSEQWHYLSTGPSNRGGAANCITLDGIGGIYVGGHFWNSSYLCQLAVVKLSPAGDTQWVYIHPHIPPSPFSDNVRDIVADDVGNIYVAGKICVAQWDDDIVVLKFGAQGGVREVRDEKITRSKHIVTILKGGIEIFAERRSGLSIYDVSGRVVVKQNLQQRQKTFIKLGSGVYFVKIESKNNVLRKKVIVL